MSDEIPARKDSHLQICLERPVESGAATGLGALTLEYDALPELDLEQVDLTAHVLGRRLRAPLIIGAMTGGTPRAAELNRRLARAAARVRVGFALGSQRAMIVDPQLAPTFAVREQAPELPLLFGNVGAVQLNLGVTPEQVAGALQRVAADAAFLHLNPLHEALQPQGDTRFGGLAARIADAIPRLGLPVLIKEVGAGISPRTARKLSALPIAGVEVAGVGGTSWARVESYRAAAGDPRAEIGERLAGFGVPTAASIGHCRAALGDRLVIASGGVRTGLDVAVALALGADAVALARPLLAAAAESEEAVVRALEALLLELRIICFCTGARDLAALRAVRVLSRDQVSGSGKSDA